MHRTFYCYDTDRYITVTWPMPYPEGEPILMTDNKGGTYRLEPVDDGNARANND